jgi:2-dehydro-3-deoxyphosphogluconate aldolase/(4S)-4-hydroxy-2-oxoglutarate aldolase
MSAPRTRRDVLDVIETTGVVAVVRLSDAAQAAGVASALSVGGVRAIEITMTVPRAVELIAELSDSLPADVIVGAGTVVTSDTAEAVIAAGARFVVSPVLRPGVIDACRRHDIAVMPGCFTPTEILTAWEAGADIVKVFPATALGPTFFKDIRGPLPQVRLMPTGGVTRDNAGDWIRAGAAAVGVGTALVDQRAVAARQFDVIAANARHFIQAVQHARGSVEAGGTASGVAVSGAVTC